MPNNVPNDPNGTTSKAPVATASAPPPAESKPTSRLGLIRMHSDAPNVRTAGADAIVSRGGRLHRVATLATLRFSQGHFYTIDKGPNPNFMIQAAGYDELNTVMGLQFVQPPTVPVDGRDEPNPFVMRQKDGRITAIYIRAALVGRDLTGTQRIVMETLVIDPETWYRLALIKAVQYKDGGRNGTGYKGWSDTGRFIATRSIAAQNFDDNFVIYPVDDETSIVVDLRSYKIRAAIENRVTMQRDATKRALTILRRRLYTAHPGAPSVRLARGSVKIEWGTKPGRFDDGESGEQCIVEAIAEIPVLGWIDDSPTSENITDTLRRTGKIVQDAMVDDLGTADTLDVHRGEEGDDGAPMESEPVKRAENVQPSATGASPEAVSEAQAILASLAKLPGGRARKDEIVRKFTNNERPLEDLTKQEIRDLIDAAMRAAQEITAARTRRPAGPAAGAAPTEGGAS